MADVYTTRTTTGYGGKLKNSLSAALVGMLMFIGSFFLLSWNEGNSVKVHAALDWAEANLVIAAPSPLDRALEGKVVYVSGASATPEQLTDAEFAVGGSGLLRLKRTVEMYQWDETKTTHTKDKLGGGEETVTEYKYAAKWSEQAIDSSRFHMAGQYRNPPMLLQSKTFNAQQATLGDYHLSTRVLQEMEAFDTTLTPTPKAGFSVNGNQLYQGIDPQAPKVGDVRISFSAIPAGPVSVIGKQTGNEIAPARAPSARDVLLVENAAVEAAAMFDDAHKQQTMLTWLLRLVGFLLMGIGLIGILQPLRALVSFIPALAWVFDFGAGIISFGLAFILSAATIAIAWFAYRPVLSAIIFGGGAALALGLWALRRPKTVMAPAPASPAGDGQQPIVTRG